ncbi:hypothetical protein [Lactococcus taiwanensis]|uniref:hypothetical protein n=1 Tax=Lactococcus taiwanensis TaxID=1151742 RepID=UPI003518A9FB
MKKIRQKMKENVAATKFGVVLILLGAQAILLLATFWAPDKQFVPSSQLTTTQTFPDGSGTLEITHQEYDKKNRIIKLDLQATEELSMNQLKPKLFVRKGEGMMQYIPTVDNKAEIFIKDIPENFEALSLSFQNKDASQQPVDTTIYDNALEAKSVDNAQSEKEAESDIVYFFVASNSKYLKQVKIPIKIKSQEDYAIEAIKSEIKFQNTQMKKMDTAVQNLKKNQKIIHQKIEDLRLKTEYLTGNNLSNAQSQISNLESNLENDAQQIQEAEQNKKVITQAIAKMQKQILDIRAGKYQFPADEKSQRMKK